MRLMQLVPEGSQQRNAPCRHIPLNDQGDTLEFLYRSGTDKEIETTFTEWLKTTISRLERERAESLRAAEHPEIHVRGKFVAGG